MLPRGRSAHVDFWLAAEGREQLEDSLLYKAGWMERGRRGLRRHATGVYLGAFFFLTSLFALLPSFYLALVGASLAAWGAALPLFLLPASMLAFTSLHWMLSRILPPTVLPKLDFERGIPSDCKTAVVIPSLLGSSDDVEHLLRQIERHHRELYRHLNRIVDRQQSYMRSRLEYARVEQSSSQLLALLVELEAELLA